MKMNYGTFNPPFNQCLKYKYLLNFEKPQGGFLEPWVGSPTENMVVDLFPACWSPKLKEVF
jgi:hypothetical protein